MTFTPRGPRAPKGWPIGDLQNLVNRVETDPKNTTEWWRISSRKAARIGDRVYVFKQGKNPRGIFGVGVIVGGPEVRSTPTDPLKCPRAEIRFERLVDPTKEFLLPLEANKDILSDNLVTAHASGNSVPDEIANELEKRLASLPALSKVGATDAEPFDPRTSSDEREKILREIHARRGQPEFRSKLLEAYGRRCAISGCTVEAVLEAAHLSPYQGLQTNHVTNGILLRADIHTLYDYGLIAIEPDTRTIIVADVLTSSEYARMAGTLLREPANVADRPGIANLKACYQRFRALQMPG
ncbi:HNH endonuclease [Methylobacterium sp. Leaf113]|uniref:HNH endonuclease n=1 Tax=Methylobacterium sp. Leaf113 TaxID=1736259 RepID=UPI00138EE73C|nr:HNH endonuclease [Methylobacterium sp. Leaf113]